MEKFVKKHEVTYIKVLKTIK